MVSHEKALWLLECSEGKMGRLFLFYAGDEEEARIQANQVLVQYPDLTEVSLHPQLQGFVLMYERRPGYRQ